MHSRTHTAFARTRNGNLCFNMSPPGMFCLNHWLFSLRLLRSPPHVFLKISLGVFGNANVMYVINSVVVLVFLTESLTLRDALAVGFEPPQFSLGNGRSTWGGNGVGPESGGQGAAACLRERRGARLFATELEEGEFLHTHI